MAACCGSRDLHADGQSIINLLPKAFQAVMESQNLERQQQGRGFETSALLSEDAFSEISEHRGRSYDKSLSANYTVRAYAPRAFRSVRYRFGISDDEYRRSLCTKGSIKG